MAQWARTGSLNAQVEEAFTGHALVKVFGRQQDVEDRFNETNEELYEAGFGAQFIAGVIQPVMMFLEQPELRDHRRGRRPAGGLRGDEHR